MGKSTARGFAPRHQQKGRLPWVAASSVNDWKDWAKAVVPAPLAYRMWLASETDYNLEVPQIGGWSHSMCFIAAHDRSYGWIIRFTSFGENWNKTARGRAAFTNGVKLVYFAMTSLAMDDETDFPIPSYDKRDLERGEELRGEISQEDAMETLEQLALADLAMKQ